MGKIITVINEKGGCAKTMTVFAIGSLLSRKGFNVLLIDLDKQADLSSNLKVPSDKVNIYDLITGKCPLSVEEINPHLWCIPGTDDIHLLDENRNKIKHKETLLSDVLGPLVDRVDYMIFDCPPNVDAIQSVAALCMSDYVIIPAETGSANAATGVDKVLSRIESIREEYNPNLSVLGVLVTRFESSVNLHKDMRNAIIEKFPDAVFETPIRENVFAGESATLGMEFEEYFKFKSEKSKVKIKQKPNVIKDYEDLTMEIIERINALAHVE